MERGGKGKGYWRSHGRDGGLSEAVFFFFLGGGGG